MDANRFDVLTKSMATPASRRRALGVLTAGGLFGAFARSRGSTAAQTPTCTFDFVTTVRLGPTSGEALTSDATAPGEVRGELSFGLSSTGDLEDGSLRLTDGTTLPVVGQATGHSLQLRIDGGQGLVFVSVGVGERDVADCQGAIDGMTAGPQPGDLGDWHAVALGQAAATSTGGTASRPPGGPPPSAPPGTAPTAVPTTPSGPSLTCPANQTACSGVCVDLSSDLNHCGACGAVCESRLVAVECRSGVCERANCPVGQTYCGAVDGCRDTATDPNHCGGCQQPCMAGVACAAGVCIGEPDPDPCGPGLTTCEGECVDLSSHDFHCGACGNLCANIGPNHFCEGGVCIEPQCPADTIDCSGVCYDPLTTSFHCGMCGNVCAAGQSCQGGVCSGGAPPPPPDPGPTCAPGLENCFGTCVDISNDSMNCAGCGIACPAGQFCQSRVCVAGTPDCGPGLTPCGGICLDLNTDPFACGACTNVCAEGQTCQAGTCAAPA